MFGYPRHLVENASVPGGLKSFDEFTTECGGDDGEEERQAEDPMDPNSKTFQLERIAALLLMVNERFVKAHGCVIYLPLAV